MFKSSPTRHATAMLGACLVFSATQAFALNAESLIKRYQEASEVQGQLFTYGTITKTGDGTYAITDPVWTIPTVSPIKAGSLVFSGVEEEADGRITIGRIVAEGISSGSETVSVTFDNAVMEGLKLAAPGETDLIKKMALYSRFTTGPGKVTFSGTDVAKMSDSDFTVSDYDLNTPMIMSAAMNGLEFDLSPIPDPKFRKALADLGYGTSFTGRIEMKAKWDMSAGVMEINQYDMVLKDVGTLSMPFSIGGYGIQQVLEMQALTKTLEGKPPEEVQREYEKIFKGMYPIKGELAFKDDSLTERALKMASVQMGQPADQLAAGLPMMVSIGMGQLNLPELSAMASDAIGKFLQTRGTIRIAATPKQPFDPKEYQAAQKNPAAIMELLQLKVSAD